MDLRRRLTGLIVEPRREWSTIAAEPDDVVWLYRHFIAIVAAVPAAALLLRFAIAAAPILGVRAAISRYLVALASPMVAAVVVEKLAPRFQSRGSTAQALKLVAYASTPVWVAGVCYLVLMLAPLALIAVLYAIYLFYLGLPILMKTPYEQVVPSMVVTAIAILMLNIVLRSIVGVLGLPMYGY